MTIVRIKTQWEKRLELSNIASTSHCPLSFAFVRRPFHDVEIPSAGNPPTTFI